MGGNYSIKVYWTDSQGGQHVTQDSASRFNPDDYGGTITSVESMGGGPASGAPRDSGGRYTIYSGSGGMYPKAPEEQPDYRERQRQTQQVQAASGTAPWNTSGTTKSIDVLTTKAYQNEIARQEAESSLRLRGLMLSSPRSQYQTESGEVISRSEAIRREVAYRQSLRQQKKAVGEYPEYADFRQVSVDNKPVSLSTYFSPIDFNSPELKQEFYSRYGSIAEIITANRSLSDAERRDLLNANLATGEMFVSKWSPEYQAKWESFKQDVRTKPYGQRKTDRFGTFSPIERGIISLVEGGMQVVSTPASLIQLPSKIIFGKTLLPDISSEIEKRSLGPPDVVESAISQEWFKQEVPQWQKEFQMKYPVETGIKSATGFVASVVGFSGAGKVARFGGQQLIKIPVLKQSYTGYLSLYSSGKNVVKNLSISGKSTLLNLDKKLLDVTGKSSRFVEYNADMFTIRNTILRQPGMRQSISAWSGKPSLMGVQRELINFRKPFGTMSPTTRPFLDFVPQYGKTKQFFYEGVPSEYEEFLLRPKTSNVQNNITEKFVISSRIRKNFQDINIIHRIEKGYTGNIPKLSKQYFSSIDRVSFKGRKMFSVSDFSPNEKVSYALETGGKKVVPSVYPEVKSISFGRKGSPLYYKKTSLFKPEGRTIGRGPSKSGYRGLTQEFKESGTYKSPELNTGWIYEQLDLNVLRESERGLYGSNLWGGVKPRSESIVSPRFGGRQTAGRISSYVVGNIQEQKILSDLMQSNLPVTKRITNELQDSVSQSKRISDIDIISDFERINISRSESIQDVERVSLQEQRSEQRQRQIPVQIPVSITGTKTVIRLRSVNKPFTEVKPPKTILIPSDMGFGRGIPGYGFMRKKAFMYRFRMAKMPRTPFAVPKVKGLRF